VLALEEPKTAQEKVITRLKLRGRMSDKIKLMFNDSDFDMLDDDIENVKGETVNAATLGVSAASAPVTTAGVAFSTAEPRTPPITRTTGFNDDEDLTITHTLVKMGSEKAKEKGVVFRDEEETPRLIRSTTTLQHLPTIDSKDKGKGVLIEEEHEKLEKVKRRD
ncbi:hypothetical protein Tco_0182301, partial [Tanacetum coccineum]